MLIGFDETDIHGIDQNIMRRPLVRQNLGQSHAGATRDGSRRRTGPRRLGADIEHVDDAPPFLRFHVWPGETREADGGEQFLIKIALPNIVGDVLEGAIARRAGIV